MYYIFFILYFRVLCTYITKQNMHVFKHVQSHIIILHQHVSVTHVTIIRAPYNKKTSKLPYTTYNCTKMCDKTIWYYT